MVSSPLPLQTHDVLDDMLTSGGSPRDLTEQQCSQLRQFFEDTDVGLWFFIQHVFGFQDMRPDLHLPICRLVGHWGETHLTDGRIVTTPPGDEEERLLHRSYRRIMVRIPRECFKTSYFTRANSLWTVAKNPDATIGIFNEKEENVESWIDAIREVVENSVLFQVVWRHIIPRGIGFWDKEKGIGPSRKLKWGGGGLLFERSTHGVSELSIEGHGVGGATAGKHFTHTILDDIIGLKAQQSEAVMLQAIEWINKKRPLERPAENGCELVNHTTWAYGDVYEHMLRQWPGEYLVHKRSLLENPTTGEPDTVEGRSIFPEKISTLKAYRMLKADGFTFHAQYQNEPKAGKAQSFSEEHLHHFRIIEASDKLYLRIEDEDYDPQCYDLESGEQEAPQFVPLTLLDRAIIIDPAPSKGPEVKREPKSRNGLVAAGTDPWGRRFALQSVPSLEGPTEVLKQAIGLYRRWGGRIAIEEVIFSAVYWPLWQRIMELDPQYQDVRPEFRPLLTRNRDKDQRIRDNGIPDWENNRWYLNNAQCGHLEKEVLEFPYGETKDLVDAWSYTKEATDRPESFVEAESRHRSQMREQRGVTGYGW